MIFQAERELLERLRQRTRERGVAVAQLIREALERELGDASQPSLSIIGTMPTGASDLSRRSEDEYEPPRWRA